MSTCDCCKGHSKFSVYNEILESVFRNKEWGLFDLIKISLFNRSEFFNNEELEEYDFDLEEELEEYYAHIRGLYEETKY